MQDQTFRDAIEVIYATFGKAIPSSGAIHNAIRSRAISIPDEAVPWIVAKICDEAMIPQNLGRAFAQGWEAWQVEHPQRVIKFQCRAGCDHGFLNCFWHNGTRWTHCVSPCPECQGNKGPVPSRRELEERGIVVMPDGFKGGAFAFDRQNGFGVFSPVGKDVQ